MRWATLLLVAVMAFALHSAWGANSAPPSRSSVIRGDRWIGSFAVKGDGTLAGAIRAFGRPTSMRRMGLSCKVKWRPLRLRIFFYNLGGRNPCRRQWGYFSEALITGREWRTGKGLRIGDPSRALHLRYPRAERHGLWWWLVVRTLPYGRAPNRYAGLAAKVLHRRVVAFVVNYPAGGD